MLLLPNNCRAGNISVYPKNWKTVRANGKLIWRIKYRFYDDNLNKCKQVVIKGMNEYSTAEEKRSFTQSLIDDELDLVQRQGFNHITRTFSIVNEDLEISEWTLFIPALKWASDNLKAEPKTKQDIANTLEWVYKGILALQYDKLTIGKIRRRHIKLVLEKVGKLKLLADISVGKNGKTRKGQWSANQFNVYRKYLSILFANLLEVDAVESNWVKDISKEKQLKRKRVTLSSEQRGEIDRYLFDKYPTFWRFLHIFFHSGSRESEMMFVKKKHVDLDRQRFMIIQKKGKEHSEEYRTIKTIALPLWQEIMREAGPEDYLFSIGLRPGAKNIRPDQITKRWYRLVKKKLAVTADFYSLKHSNLDEIARQLSAKDASNAAGHSSPVVTMKHYLIGEEERQHNRLKDVSNTF